MDEVKYYGLREDQLFTYFVDIFFIVAIISIITMIILYKNKNK